MNGVLLYPNHFVVAFFCFLSKHFATSTTIAVTETGVEVAYISLISCIFFFAYRHMLCCTGFTLESPFVLFFFLVYFCFDCENQ